MPSRTASVGRPGETANAPPSAGSPERTSSRAATDVSGGAVHPAGDGRDGDAVLVDEAPAPLSQERDREVDGEGVDVGRPVGEHGLPGGGVPEPAERRRGAGGARVRPTAAIAPTSAAT